MILYNLQNNENKININNPPQRLGFGFKVIILTLNVVFFVSMHLKSNAQTANEYYFMAIAEKEYGNYSEALLNITLALNQEPNNIVFLTERGNIKIRNNKLNAAINDFRKAEKTKSNSASLYLAQTYSLLNNLDSAIFFLDKYVHYYDKKPMPDIVLDSAFYSINKTNEWKAFWLEDYYTNVEKMMQNVKYNYKHHQVALALIEVNDIIKKYKTYHKAYFLKAKILFDGGNYQKAKKFTSKAIKISPLQSDYFLLRAETYMKLKKYNNAADDFMQSLKINPYQPKVYLLLAESQYKNKKYTDAVISINKYTDAFYKHYDAFFFEALINFDAGNYLTSIKILNILLASDSNNSKYLSLRGKSYLNTHSYKLAYNDFNICLDINPKLTDTYFYRGLAEFEMNMTDAACADWKRAIKYKDYKANDYYYEYCKDFDRNNH